MDQPPRPREKNDRGAEDSGRTPPAPEAAPPTEMSRFRSLAKRLVRIGKPEIEERQRLLSEGRRGEGQEE